MGKKWLHYCKNLLKLGLILGVIGCLGLLTTNWYVINTTKAQILTKETIGDYNADCILILGAGVWANNEISPMLQDRLDKGIELAQAGLHTPLLMSGDHGQDNYDEVNPMKNYAIDQGLASSAIFMDHAGFSTYDSLYRAQAIFMAKKIIIVSQKEHLYRALYIARALGLEAIGVAAEPKIYGGQWVRDLRESLARVKDAVMVLFKPQSTLLGDPISLTGNGDITNDID